MADDHSSKIARLLYRDVDVDEHIQNMSSYNLSFFDKLVLCRGLQFAIPEPRISAFDIQATFEEAFWKLEPILSEDKKELAAAILRSIALSYTKRKGPKPPKPLVRSIQKLKTRDDIVITKPDKHPVQTPSDSPVRITLPFKHQKSADVVRRQLGDLGAKINQQLQPFLGRAWFNIYQLN